MVFSSIKVSSYFSLKDVSDPSLKSLIVYCFTCLVDPSTTYVGKTKKHLQQRINEHLKDKTAVKSHIDNCLDCKNNRNINLQFSIIDRANTDFETKILEALYIEERKPNLNKQLFGSGTSFLLNIF